MQPLIDYLCRAWVFRVRLRVDERPQRWRLNASMEVEWSSREALSP